MPLFFIPCGRGSQNWILNVRNTSWHQQHFLKEEERLDDGVHPKFSLISKDSQTHAMAEESLQNRDIREVYRSVHCDIFL
jgi:hypothetical protein